MYGNKDGVHRLDYPSMTDVLLAALFKYSFRQVQEKDNKGLGNEEKTRHMKRMKRKASLTRGSLSQLNKT